MNDTFCPNPFVYLTNSTYGKIKFCCLIPTAIENNEGIEVTSDATTRLEQIWNCKTLLDVRDNMLSGEKVSGCEVCYNNERNGGGSLRKDLNSQWNNLESEYGVHLARAIEAHTNKQLSIPVSVEVRTGNICNLKCRMCTPDDSILIEKEYKLLQKKNQEWSQMGFSAGSSSVNHDGYYNEILDNLVNIKLLRLSGGEPFLNKFTFDIIDKSIQLDVAKDIELSINSNLTSVTSDVLWKLQKFKKVTLDLSLDGVGPVHEYIRSGINWEELEEKIAMVKTYLTDNFSLTTNTTIQIYNILDIENILQYTLRKMEVTPVLFMLDNPAYLDVRNMPPKLKVVATDRLHQLITSDLVTTFKYSDWLIGRLRSAIERIKEPNNIQQIEHFKYFTAMLDTNRKQEFASALPEIQKYYEYY